MNVELPDGTVVEDIPEGISRKDLAVKLQANGMKVPQEWLGPKKVGVVESAGRTAASAAQSAVKFFDMAMAGLGTAAAESAIAESEAAGIPVAPGTREQIRSGAADTTDTMFRDSDERQKRMTEQYGQKEGEEFPVLGRVIGGVAGIGPAILTGPIGMGVNRARDVLERGGSGTEAAKAGAVTTGLNAAMMAVPAGAGFTAAGRGAAAGMSAAKAATVGATTGAALGAAGAPATAIAENAALPDRPEFEDLKADPFSLESVMTSMATGAVFGGVGGKHANKAGKAKADAAPGPFPADKFESLGNDEYRAPNGATVTKEAWENSSKRVRDGWMKAPEKPPEEPKLPVGEAKELGPEALADTSAIDKFIEENPTGEVAKVAARVKQRRQKAAAAAAQKQRDQAEAENMRRAAGTTDDAELKAELLKDADKLYKEEKLPVGEVKEGQPDIKTEEPNKIPVGEAKELPAEEVTGRAPDAEPLPKGEVTEYPEGGTPVPREEAAKPTEPVPAGEARELYADPNRPQAELNLLENPNATGKINEQEGVQPQRVNGNEVGQAAEAGRGDRVQRAAEGSGQKAEGHEALDLGLPKIDEAFMREQERATEHLANRLAKHHGSESSAQVERGRRQVRAALEKGAADGTLDKDGVALATWALDKNPNLSRGLRLEASDKPPVPNAKGAYNSAEQIVRVFKGADDVKTATHEILHHSERMMPEAVQNGIRKEWRRHIQAEAKKASPAVRAALNDIPRAMAGDKEARARLLKAFEVGLLNKDKHYHLFDPSEFWAVKATDILHERHTSRGSWRAQARTWLREMVEHVKGVVGMRSDAPVLKALDELLNPKKTTGVDRAGKMVVKAEAGDPGDMSLAVGGKRVLADETKAEVVERKLFDRFNRVAKLQKEEAPKSESADIYQGDVLYAGRVQERGEALERDHIKPLGKALAAAKKAGLTVRDADDYLMALHAPERNAAIAQRNPKMPDGGSGLSNQQAKDIIDSFTPEQRKHLDAVADIIHKLNREKLDTMVDDGLITAQQRDDLNKQFKKYVPLKTLEGEDSFLGTGRGYEMRANDITTALGRSSKASSPIAASIMDASRALIRGEKARVDRTIWEYAQNKDAHDFIKPYDPDNPPPEVMDRKIGPDGKVKDIVKSSLVEKMTMNLVVDGKDVRVFVPDELLRDQLKKVASTVDPGPVLGAVAKVTGTIGRMYTEFNPSFTVPNAVKDAIVVAIRAGSHDGVSVAKTMANIPVAWKTITQHKLGVKNKATAEYQEFLSAGGKTGAYGIQGVVDTMKKLEKAGARLGYDQHAAGYARKVARFLKIVPHAISNMNEVLEYASRFAFYKEMRAAGNTPAKSAAAAKEITVNFNRSGEFGRTMNSVLVFANAALQGLRNTAVYMKSRKVQAAMVGLVALGAAIQAWNEQVGGINEETGDPNINTQHDAVADKNIVLMKPDSSEGYKIPLPPEYAFPYLLGRRIYRGFTQGNVTKEAAGVAGGLLDATLPVRLPDADNFATAVVKSVVPTPVAPEFDLLFNNRGYFGTPIVPETHDKKSPGPYYTRARPSTSDFAKAVSELANSATGGDSVRPGWSEKALGPLISPEGIDHLVGQYTGGLGQLAVQSTNIARNIRDDKPQDVNKLPVVSRFMFTEPKSYTDRRFRELATDYEYAKDYLKAGQAEKIDPRVQATLEQYEVANKELTALFKELREAGASGADREPIQQQIKQVQARVIKAFNSAPKNE